MSDIDGAAELERQELVAQWHGYCPICRHSATFSARQTWFRDHLLCDSCGSIPRERALMLVLEREVPKWCTLAIHEISPLFRGTSEVIRRECPGYVPTYFYPETPPGTVASSGFRCEDVELQTFADQTFDVVISQDVMEHVFRPDRAYREIYRTLRANGLHIHTTPVYKEKLLSTRRAARKEDGSLAHYATPEFHGDPINSEGALVTYHFGHDLPEKIVEWAGFDVEMVRFNDRHHGIVGEFTEVIICRRRR